MLQIERAIEEMEQSMSNNESPHPFMREADQNLRDAIIREWQECMSTANLRQVVCAPCARYANEEDTHLLDPSQVDLQLLRNDDLPPHVHPRTPEIAFQSKRQ